ncbi:hypothetical protein ACIF80_22935 [Streptomyces sp. NPDC085927]|uniref:hypothetical protein n=1 Tax=Streptomyces sp. NPDC085927 TaxID=3365738 RepID=UPI0037D504A5
MAGFLIVNEEGETAPGLRARLDGDGTGVLVTWMASQGFEALVDCSRGPGVPHPMVECRAMMGTPGRGLLLLDILADDHGWTHSVCGSGQ